MERSSLRTDVRISSRTVHSRFSVLQISIMMALGMSAFGCSGDGRDVLTYEEFKARAYQEPETGVFIFAGDTPAENEEQLRAAYESYANSVQDSPGERLSVREQALTVNLINGQFDKWSAADARNLRYCVSQATFGANYTTVVNAMNAAAAAWESITWVDFIHVSSLDGACDQNTAGVTFDVRQVCGLEPFGARAFFPSEARANRNILIHCSQYNSAAIAPLTLNGVVRHELGHVLGFRHEHERPESGQPAGCSGANWSALTVYDPASVMHYRLPYQCGAQQSDYTISALDQQGAAILYPPPAPLSAAFYINGQVNGNITLTANTPFTLNYISSNAVSCDLAAYWNGSLWYSVPNYTPSHDWGTVTGFGTGNYSWNVVCRNAAGQTVSASASLTMTVPPCDSRAGTHGQMWTSVSVYAQYAYASGWCSVGTSLPPMCYEGTYYFYQYLTNYYCTSGGSSGSCYDSNAWWWVTCQALVDCIYDCSGQCVKAGC